MIRKSLLALAALTLAGAAVASPHSITGSFDSNPGVTVLTGTFDFDDAQVAAGGFDGAFDLTALDFVFNGESFTLAQAAFNSAYVQFDGGTLTGPNGFFTTAGGGTLELQSFFGSSNFTFSTTRGDQLGTLAVAATVPEPMSLALVLGGLAAVGAASRRRKAA
ncbi:hypothetical protein J2X20_001779 [Pelomonas saccharophila]|uniref:PEP-CTERM protein-sorting domain-containing protein n=1 Tax=Roseateles saccharophilus TaxID=304 RepID=A0ABU1YLQ7_ROSSA|nr:PEP-CTERM sorting domain-containing protein [Roseateles saccharophilus]MDR7269150.1 hypothetical protein [Roseateles saccharophilus]